MDFGLDCSVAIFKICLLKLVYLKKYSHTVCANFVVFQNPGWNFPKAWVDPNPGWDFSKPWVEFFLPPPRPSQVVIVL